MALRKASLTFADGFVTECTVLTDDEVEFEGMATTRPAPWAVVDLNGEQRQVAGVTVDFPIGGGVATTRLRLR